MDIGLSHYLTVAAVLFTIGIAGIILNRKNIIVILMSVELILLAVNVNLVAFSSHLGDLTGQHLRVVVINSKSFDVVFHRIHGRRGDDSRLPQRAAEQLASAASFANVILAANQDRAHRTAKSLRETNRNRVEMLGDVRRRVSLRDTRVEEPRAIEMRLQTVVVRPTANAR